MPTNLALDDRLIEEARQVGQHKTKKGAVTAALKEYIKYRRQLEVLSLAGTIDFNPDYDYKAQRGEKTVKVLIDTPIWSLALRRRPPELSSAERDLVAAWGKLVEEKRAVLAGPVRQELLSGVRIPAVFDRLRGHLRAFDDEPLACEDYEEAARCFNICRGAGVAGSNIDFLLCAMALRRRLEIFTTDADFHHYAKHLPIRLHETQSARR